MSGELVKTVPIDLATLPKLDRPHHLDSPSGLGMKEACPCFENMQSAVLHERTVAGTRGHAVAETGEDDNELSDDDAAAAVECIQFIAQRRALMERSGPVTELKEQYLSIDDEDTTAGYFDHALLNHDITYAEIVDFKFGRWHVVDAASNPQAISYTLGLFRAYPTLQQIRFFFKMPILEHVSEALFSRSQIPELYLRICTIVARAKAARATGDFAAAKPHVGICTFCRHLGRCPKVAELALKVGAKFHPLQIPDSVLPSAIHGTRDTTLAMRLSQVLGVWAGAVRQTITNRVVCREADVPEGFVIAQKSEREVVNPEKYKEIALKHVTPEQYQNSCNVVFGRIEKCIKDAHPRGQKTAAIASFNSELESAGAIKSGDSFTFLKAVSSKDE